MRRAKIWKSKLGGGYWVVEYIGAHVDWVTTTDYGTWEEAREAAVRWVDFR